MITESKLSEMETEAREAMGSALWEYCPAEFFELVGEVRKLRKVAKAAGICTTALLQSELTKDERGKLIDIIETARSEWRGKDFKENVKQCIINHRNTRDFIDPKGIIFKGKVPLVLNHSTQMEDLCGMASFESVDVKNNIMNISIEVSNAFRDQFKNDDCGLRFELAGKVLEHTECIGITKLEITSIGVFGLTDHPLKGRS